MTGADPQDEAEIAQALGTTGWFLENRLVPALGGKPLPAARAGFIDRLVRV
jgi:DNA repair protein RecO (recombination protein O)